jgi:hypothetical protein
VDFPLALETQLQGIPEVPVAWCGRYLSFALDM